MTDDNGSHVRHVMAITHMTLSMASGFDRSVHHNCPSLPLTSTLVVTYSL
jgi:hypothetical protein